MASKDAQLHPNPCCSSPDTPAVEIREARAVAIALPEWIRRRFELGFRPRTMAAGKKTLRTPRLFASDDVTFPSTAYRLISLRQGPRRSQRRGLCSVASAQRRSGRRRTAVMRDLLLWISAT